MPASYRLADLGVVKRLQLGESSYSSGVMGPASRDKKTLPSQHFAGASTSVILSWLPEQLLAHALVGQDHGDRKSRTKRAARFTDIFPANVYYSSAGAIPAQLGALNKLTWLGLSNNQLSGEQLMEFVYIFIFSNILMYPANMYCRRVRNFRIRGITFCTPPNCPTLTPSSSGHIPPQLGDLGALKCLYLSDNKLDGEL